MVDGYMCKEVKARCKFCGKDLTLHIAEDYDEVGDSLKIMKLAACNRCADLKTRIRRLEGDLSKECGMLLTKPHFTIKDRIKSRLAALSRAYLNTISNWLNREPAQWEETILEDMLENPNKLDLTVKAMWTLARQQPVKSFV
jgi:hypothetical protein